MNPDGPEVTVDTRQPDPAFEVQLLNGLGVPAKLGYLPTGDYSWESPLGLVLVERKKAVDLLHSLTEGRLDDQLQRLVAESFWPFLLIEGQLREFGGRVSVGLANQQANGRVDFDAMDNALVSWQARGVLIKHSPNPASTYLRLAALYRWTQNATGRVRYVPRKRRLPNLGRLSERAEVLAGIPGIGPRRAEAMAALAPLRVILGEWGEAEFTSATGSRKLAQQILRLLEEPA